MPEHLLHDPEIPRFEVDPGFDNAPPLAWLALFSGSSNSNGSQDLVNYGFHAF